MTSFSFKDTLTDEVFPRGKEGQNYLCDFFWSDYVTLAPIIPILLTIKGLTTFRYFIHCLISSSSLHLVWTTLANPAIF
jgi:hypothetical protein